MNPSTMTPSTMTPSTMTPSSTTIALDPSFATNDEADTTSPPADSTVDTAIQSDTAGASVARWPALAVLMVSTVLTGMFAGFFFTYSASVVLGFDQVDDLTYVRSFQAINDTIRNPAFAIVFFGSIPAAVIAIAVHRHDRVVRRLATAGLVLIVAVVAITFAGSVPLNNELATYTDLDAATAAIARADFESTWNLLNLARSVLATAAAIALASASITARSTRR